MSKFLTNPRLPLSAFLLKAGEGWACRYDGIQGGGTHAVADR